MKKKIKDLNNKEMDAICKKHGNKPCEDCQLYLEQGCDGKPTCLQLEKAMKLAEKAYNAIEVGNA